MSGDAKPRQGGSWSGRIATLKDLFALLRDLSLFAIGVLLLVFPTRLNSVLTDAGFEEGSIVGFKWKRKLVESDTELRKTLDSIADLQAQNANLTKALAEAKSRLNDVPLNEKITKLQTDNQQITAAAKQVQSSVAQTIAANAPLVEKARLATRSESLPAEGFCYQEDRLADGPERYSVHCHTSKPRCETARGPNLRWKQSACEFVELSQAKWNPKSQGWMGSWYEFRSQPFEPPFPQIK
ncbi:MAG TPA: hypothetical protein VIA62_08435 [Thermoanaerobaculia bacterium]|jgi:hypothetical protein|nr:hypothetical protein [Thermoanaerobaculia bacterium]